MVAEKMIEMYKKSEMLQKQHRRDSVESVRRWLQVHILTFMYNASNTVLYIESLNEFPEHWGLFGIEQPLSEYDPDRPAGIAFFIAIFLSAWGTIGVQNQKRYSDLIFEFPLEEMPVLQWAFPPKKTLFELHPVFYDYRFDDETSDEKWSWLALAAALYKAAVASSSFAALLKTWICPWPAILASVIFFVGNFIAQFAVLSGNKKIPYKVSSLINKISPEMKRLLIHFFTFCYNITNVVLYFNAGDDFLRRINVLDHRLSQGTPGFLLLFLCIGSVSMFASTQRSYSRRVSNFFKKSGLDPWEHTGNKIKTFLYGLEAKISAFYKMAITVVSLITAAYSIFSNHLSGETCIKIGAVVAFLCFTGNWIAQYAVLKPAPSKQQYDDDRIEPKVSKSWCCGIFGKTVKAEIGGYPNPNGFAVNIAKMV